MEVEITLIDRIEKIIEMILKISLQKEKSRL